MIIDPIIAEIREIREAYAKKFNYDIGDMVRDLQARQAQSGHPLVSFVGQPTAPPVATMPVAEAARSEACES